MNIDFLKGFGLDEEAAASIAEAVAEEIRTAVEEEKSLRIRDKYQFAVKGSLMRAGAKNLRAAEAILAHDFNGEDFDVEPSGLSDAVDALCAEAPYLFGSEEPCDTVVYTFVGISPAEDSDGEISPGELSYSEYMRLYRN